ncbi:MAG TPA: thioredoxin family protein [Verrucomicrobiae bacterium]|nr:thioredoxin family protein [Verrucomicrobiae bacterium]
MKKIAVGLLACWVAWQAGAAEGQWLTDLSKAQAQAKEQNKLVLMDFNGSDWCPPCKALRKNVFSSQDFLDYAKNHLVLVDVDFPHEKKQSAEQKKANEKLAQKYSIEGFPTVVVLNSDGKQLKKRVGYGGESPKEFIAELQKLQTEG